MSRISPPTIAELTANLLSRTADAESLAAATAALGEVEPHEVAVGFRVEPRTAWQAATEVLGHYGMSGEAVSMPNDWAGHVVRQTAVAALPMAVGNYPQQVRDIGTLIQAADLTALLPDKVTETAASNGLAKWAAKQSAPADAVVAAGTCRAMGDFARADEIQGRVSAPVNEEAATLWQRGEYEKAAAMWAAMGDGVAVQFNRGLASLFLGRAAEAVGPFKAAVAGLPDRSPWHHLASLYLSLAEMRK